MIPLLLLPCCLDHLRSGDGDVEKPGVTKRCRTKSSPEHAAGTMSGNIKDMYPELYEKIQKHMAAFKNGDKSPENRKGMEDAMHELQRLKGVGKGKPTVKIEKQETPLYQESITPNEGPGATAVGGKGDKRKPKAAAVDEPEPSSDWLPKRSKKDKK